MTHQFFTTCFILFWSVSHFAQSNCNYDTYTSNFITGTTIVQDHFNGTTTNNNKAKTHILNSSKIVNQHLMGFGAGNPKQYPNQNDNDYSEIERRIGKTNGLLKDAETLVLTACCAPDWMKKGSFPDSVAFHPDSTFWHLIELAPDTIHYDNYAQLVADILTQDEFEDIEYVMVWNEMKGFWLPDNSGWDIEKYIKLYNKVYNAVKAVNQNIKVGGPYVSLNSYACNPILAPTYGGAWGKFDKRDLELIECWLDQKVDADFLVIDGPSRNRDGRPAGIDQFEMTDKFTDFMVWLRNLNHPDAQTLPVWWAEWYIQPESATASYAELNALMTTGLVKLVKSGVETALLWSPEGNQEGVIANNPRLVNRHCLNIQEDAFVRQLGLYDDTKFANASTTLFYQSQKHIHDYFSKGTTLIDINSNNTKIEIVASPDKMLLVNKSDLSQNTTIQGNGFTLSPYQVKLFNTPAGLIAESIGNCNVISNSTFTNNTNNWITENCNASVQSGICLIENITNVTNPWDAKFISNLFCLEQGNTYTLQFDAFSSQPRSFSVKVGLGIPPYTQYFSKAENLTNNVDRFSYPITFSQANTDNIRLEFHLGGINDAPDVYLDNVQLKPTGCNEPNPCEILENGNFNNDFTNWDDWSCTPNTTNNTCNVNQIDVVPDPWNAAIAYPNLTLIEGSTYTFSFKAQATNNRKMFIKVGLGVAEWNSYLWREENLNNQMQQFNYIFTMNQATTNLGRIEFQIGSSTTPLTIDEVSLVEQNCLQAANVGFNVAAACVENIHIETLNQSTFIQAGNTLSANTQINGDHNIHLSAGERVALQSNFEVNEGVTFTADIENCGQ